MKSGESLKFSVSDDWSPYLKCSNIKADDGKTYPSYYLAPPYGSTSLAKIAPDFAPSASSIEYLTDPGNIRLNCPYYSMRRDQYLAQNPSIKRGSEKPDTVCRQTCPIICHPYPKLILSPKASPCFQIFVLHKC